MEIGNEAEERTAVAAEFRLHGIYAANGADSLDSKNYNHRHLDGELKQIGDQHAPKAGERGDKRRKGDDGDDEPQGLVLRQAEDKHEDFDHRQIDPAEDDTVHHDAEVNSAKAAEERRWFSE